MANTPGKKVLPHLEKRRPRFGDDAAAPPPDQGRRRIRRLLAGAALLVALFAFYPVIRRQSEVSRGDGISPVTACDRLAADPADSQKVAPAVTQDELDIADASRACAQALKRMPNDGRTLYQAARIALAAKDGATGIAALRQSAAAGYAQGQFTLGRMLVRGEGLPADVCAGGKLWAAAARQRHLYAKLELAHAWREGTFKDCGLNVAEAEITRMLAEADDLVADPQQGEDLAAARKAWNP